MSMALEGIRVIDVSQVAAVPMCARHLADFGADVVHVENPATGDSWRYLQAGVGLGLVGTPSEIPYNWEAFNRNKKSLAVDLARDEGREIICRLVESADVFVTNLRLWERRKFGLECEALMKLNPRLIYGSVTGHGMKGPDADMPAYDTTVYFARSGLSHMLTVPGMLPPSPRPAFGDNVAGLGLAFGVMMALRVRDQTGLGQEVDTSLFGSAVYQLTFDAAAALTTRQDEYEYRAQIFEGTEEERRQRDELMAEARAALKRLADFQRERLPSAMTNAYETKDGRLIRVNALQSERYWAKFCKLLGRPDLEEDPRFSTKDARAENRKELYHIFREAFLTRTLAEWRPLMADLPASAFQSLVEVIEDPQARANDFFLPYDHPVYGPMEIMGSPVNLSGTPATIRSPAPQFSQHTEEVLLEAGYTRDDIARFRERGVIPQTEST